MMSTFVRSSSLNNNGDTAIKHPEDSFVENEENGENEEYKMEVDDGDVYNNNTDDNKEYGSDIKEDPEATNQRSEFFVNADELPQIKLEADITQVQPTFSQDELDIKDEPIDVEGTEEVDHGKDKYPRGCYAPGKNNNQDGFGKYLTVQEMVRLHFDPEICKIDLSKKPVMLLEKVDNYWPINYQKEKEKIVNSSDHIQVFKEEINPDWEIVAEQEILEANRDWSKNYRVVDEHQKKSGSVSRVRSGREKSKLQESEDTDEDIDDPEFYESKSNSPREDDENDPEDEDTDEDDAQEEHDDDDDDNDDEDDDDDFDDEDFTIKSRRRAHSLSPDLEDIKDNLRILDVDDEDSLDQSELKVEIGENDINFEDIKIVDIGGFQIETFGDYSRCPKCMKHIKSTFIIRHIKLHDIPVRTLKCPYKSCKTTFTRTNNLYRHLKAVHNAPMPYICIYKECVLKFKESKSLRDHVRSVHREPTRREIEDLDGADDKYKCEFPGCGKEYGKRQHLKEHFRKHTGDMRYSCEVCGERFFVHGHMKRHLYSHTGIKPHACRWKCGAIFASYGGRMKHERAQHSENPYKLECDICGRPFRFDRELDKHKLTHMAPSERIAYRCSFCGIIFDSISHRERHEQRHKDNDSFQCEDCLKFFKNEKNLRHHSKAHHEQKTEKKKTGNKNQEKKERKEPPKYPCHMCDIPIMFALTALRRHLARKHSTNFKCDKDGCSKTFAKQYQFDAHMKLHTHRNCHICGKDFKRKQNADIHLMGVHGFTKESLQSLGR